MKPTLLARLCAGTLVTFAAASAFAADTAPQYKLAGQVTLGAPDRWDYLTFDAQARRVYISHGDEVIVVDGVAGKIVGHLADLPGSHGTAIANGLQRGISDSAKNKNATLFDLVSLKPLGTAPADTDADGMAYDAATQRAFIANGDPGTLSVVDMATGKPAGTVTLDSKPEFLASDGAGHVFVNGESTKEVLKVDAKTLVVTARFPVPDCESPHGLAVDGATDRVFTSCANAKLFVLDGNTGKIVASFGIGKGSDAVVFDPNRKLVFSSNGEGNFSVIAEKGADDFEFLGNVPTLRGARTMTVDPAGGRVFVVTADIDHIDPPKTPGGRPHAVYKPGSTALYFYDPVK